MLKVLLLSLLLANCSNNNSDNSGNKGQNKKSDKNTLSDKQTLVMLDKGNIDEIKKAINKNNVNKVYDANGTSALSIAVNKGNYKVVEYLLSIEGVDLNIKGQATTYLLRLAVGECLEKENKNKSKEVIKESLKIIDLLVKKGAVVHSTELNESYDPLYAALNGKSFKSKIKGIQFDILEILLKANFAQISLNKEQNRLENIIKKTIPNSYELEENEHKKDRLNKIVMNFIDKVDFDLEDLNAQGDYIEVLYSINDPVLKEYLDRTFVQSI